MPETSIKTGDVDFILPLEEIAPMLIALVWAGEELENGRTAAKSRLTATVLTKHVTPHYAAGSKAVMHTHRK
jgi:L-asparaginase II